MMSSTENRAEDRRRKLDDQLADIKAQIRSYPQPIAGCDAQYQHLFDKRELLVEKIKDLDSE